MIPMVQDPLGLELGKQRVALLVVPRKWKVAALQDQCFKQTTIYNSKDSKVSMATRKQIDK